MKPAVYKEKKFQLIISIIILMFYVVIIAFIINASLVSMKETTIVYPGGKTRNFNMPFEDLGAPAGDFVIKGKINRNPVTSKWVHIIPDNRLLTVKINGNTVSLAGINPNALEDYYNGFYFDLGNYLSFGDNDIEIELRNYGGRSAFEIIPDFYHSVITDILIVLLILPFLVIGLGSVICFKIYKKTGGYAGLIIITVLAILAVMIRYYMRDYGSGDFGVFQGWYDYIRNHNGIFALKDKFYDYSPLWIYLVTAATYIPVNKAAALKFILFLFEITASVFASLIIFEKYRKSDYSVKISVIAFFTVLFSPTLLFNGQMWGQCDIVYVSLIIASLYCLIKNKMIPSFVFYGLAISFKQQAVFIAPLYFFLFIRKEINWKYFFILPGVYFITFVPCLISGRPVSDMFLIYFSQASNFSGLLSWGCANFYQWISPGMAGTFTPVGIVLAFSIIMIISLAVYWSKKIINKELIIKLSLISVLILPFLLPRMHERYYLPADILSIVFAFYFPEYFYIPVIIVLISFFCYGPFLMGLNLPVGLPVLAIGILACIVMVLYDLIRSLYPGGKKRYS